MANLLRIKEIIREKKLSLRDVAAKVGITEQGLQKLIRENSTKVETLETIAKVLGVSASEFFSEPGIHIPIANPLEFVKMGADVFAEQLNAMVKKKILAPYSFVEEKDKEIERLNREIGRLQTLLEMEKKTAVHQDGGATCADVG